MDFVSEVTEKAQARLKEIDSAITAKRSQRDDLNAEIRSLMQEREGVARIAAATTVRKRSKKTSPAPVFTPPSE